MLNYIYDQSILLYKYFDKHTQIMKKYLIIILILNLSIVSAKTPFDKNADKIKSLSKIHVLTDTTVLEDMKGKQLGINSEYNLLLGISLFNNLKNLLQMSIDVEFVHSISSIGLYEQDNVYIPDYRDINKHINLPVLDETIDNPLRSEFLHELNPLTDRSFDVSRHTRLHKKYQVKMLDKDFSRVQKLKLKADEAILLLITSGIKVPTSKTVGKAILTGILTLGLVSVIETSATNFNVVLLANDGTLLWAGKSLKAGKSDKDKKQLKLLRKAFKGFPIKLKKH